MKRSTDRILTTHVGNTDCGLCYRVHPEIAWAKLQSLVEGARRASRSVA